MARLMHKIKAESDPRVRENRTVFSLELVIYLTASGKW